MRSNKSFLVSLSGLIRPNTGRKSDISNSTGQYSKFSNYRKPQINCQDADLQILFYKYKGLSNSIFDRIDILGVRHLNK